jgi:hemoglobin-like flavoprotein
MSVTPVCLIGSIMTNHYHARIGDAAAPVQSFPATHLEALQRSWERIAPIADEAAQLFYSRLFELDPSLRSLFHTEQAVQRQKLMEALAFIVSCADQPDDLLPMLASLGKRHVNYGVRAEHYATAGEALLWTLDQGLGLLDTREARDAWVAAYSVVATAMGGSSALLPQPDHEDADHGPALGGYA